MNWIRELTAKNMKRKPVRTAALILIAAFLTLSVFGGSVIVAGLQNGLKSYEARLGADIVAVPYEARTKGAFESILLQGIPGTFYMDEADYEKIRDIEGVETAAPQFYLASASAGCCSVAVQIIGFDPEQDFTVQPWIREHYADKLEKGDIIVGSELTPPKDMSLTFYNTPCTVVAQLDKTGTGLDTAVYATMETIEDMVKNAQALNFKGFDGIDTEHTVSSVMVKVAEGYDVEEVVNDINIHVRHIEASRAVNMVSDISGGLANVARIIRILTLMIWILAIVILAVSFSMIIHERTREFGVLRILGASRNMISKLILAESALISGAGALLGLVIACLIVFPFGHVISAKLQLPYLMPQAGTVVLYAVVSLAAAVAAGALTSMISGRQASRQDAALAMREGE